MDDLSGHFCVTVGQLLDNAALGGFRVEVELRGGNVADGIPGACDGVVDRLGETGSPQHFELDGVVLSLASVIHAAVLHPDDG
jgi:hypothetical protein